MLLAYQDTAATSSSPPRAESIPATNRIRLCTNNKVVETKFKVRLKRRACYAFRNQRKSQTTLKDIFVHNAKQSEAENSTLIPSSSVPQVTAFKLMIIAIKPRMPRKIDVKLNPRAAVNNASSLL